jgi:SPX domain protein involved in polyphosphate accumulation
MSERDASGFRFERKYHVTDLPLREIEGWVRRNPALFRDAYPPRIINNIYLDTSNRRSLFENLDGLADRTKARIRWYGPMFGEVKRPVLEFKIKRGMVGAKEAYNLAPFIIQPGVGAAEIWHALEASNLPAGILRELRGFEPVLLNRYHRRYYVSADGEYRITLDHDLEYFRFDRRDNKFHAHLHDRESTVVELKYSGDIDRIDERVAAYFPFRVTRMSKFVTGMQAMELS